MVTISEARPTKRPDRLVGPVGERGHEGGWSAILSNAWAARAALVLVEIRNPSFSAGLQVQHHRLDLEAMFHNNEGNFLLNQTRDEMHIQRQLTA
jgi:hypothetical protein